MSEKNKRGNGGEAETQQAFLRHTIDLNTEMIAQADRLISASRSAREEAADSSPTTNGQGRSRRGINASSTI